MEKLTAFQRDLLIVLEGMDQPHGLGIKKELEDYYQVKINHGRLYPNLDTLVQKGLVEKGAIADRTNWYAVTKKGEQLTQTHKVGGASCRWI